MNTFLSAILPRVSGVDEAALEKEFSKYAKKIEVRVKKYVFSEEPLPLPRSGYELRHTSKEYIAPLKIITNVPDPAETLDLLGILHLHYFVKLSDRFSNEPILSIFVRGGDLISTDVPAGDYWIKYATGKTWYGEKYLFGPKPATRYFKAEENFNFTVDNKVASGYTIELIQRVDGNLETREIDAADW